jgi:hypothetical protein
MLPISDQAWLEKTNQPQNYSEQRTNARQPVYEHIHIDYPCESLMLA